MGTAGVMVAACAGLVDSCVSVTGYSGLDRA